MVMTRHFQARWLLVTLITLYGALVRVEALAGTYGWMPQPRWAAAVENRVARIARPLSPWGDWQPNKSGYLGDPVAYLEFARGMQSFYHGSVREPVFPTLTRVWLAILGNSDVAVSVASMTAGILAIPATYLLGSLWAPAVGLLAAFALAVELDAVRWSVYGWRDDTFMLFVALSAWAFIRLDRRPTRANGIVAGIIAASACLTRLSALSFILPALIWIAVRHAFAGATGAPRDSNRSLSGAAQRSKAAAAAFVTVALLVAPYLFNSWREAGDPFLAVNFHTRYYQDRDGRPIDTSQGALAFVGAHLVQRPLRTIDTAVTGLFVFPMQIKWGGFLSWSVWLPMLMFWLAVAGQIAALFTPHGRLLLLILYLSLIPYAITWRIGGGGEWRFTQHAYPLYLVAAFVFVDALVWRVRYWRRDPSVRLHLPAVTRPWRLAVAAAVVVLILAGRWVSPFLVARESLSSGEPATIAAGDRDGTFFRGAWSSPQRAGLITVRAAMAERVAMHVSLPEPRDYNLIIRMDPVETADPAYQPTVDLFLNGKAIAQLRLTREPGRIGVYRVPVPRVLAREVSTLDFVASHVVAVADAGPNFAWLPRDAKVAFRLWYVRVEPA
jgi:hypothetical protein